MEKTFVTSDPRISRKVQAFLQGDFLVMLMIALYLGTVPALYLALHSLSPLGAGFAALFSLITARPASVYALHRCAHSNCHGDFLFCLVPHVDLLFLPYGKRIEKMKALILYDAVFGNTEKVAQTISEALGALALPVDQASPEQVRALDLLVVGSPTRGFRPTEGMAKFLSALPKDHLAGTRVAAFDTRILLETINSKALRFLVDRGGYAANTIGKTLEKKGGRLATLPEGFLVTGEQGPLKDGELERAAAWAKKITG